MPETPANAAPRAIFYIDGFNLYYGAVKGSAYKWLNFEAYCRRLHPTDQIMKIRYFTSMVLGRTQPNQLKFWRALGTTPLVEIHRGVFKDKTVNCTHPACAFSGNRLFQTISEKRTDVNIAIKMVEDAYEDRCDHLVLISGDSDLVPPVEFIRSRFPGRKLFVYAPSRTKAEARRASELMKAAHVGRELAIRHMKDCQFPQTFKDKYGRDVTKPTEWP